MGKTLVFVDEMPSNLDVVARKGRALQGEPARLTSLPKGKNVTLIAALSKAGIIFHKYVHATHKGKRGTNADDFRLFLLDLSKYLTPNTVIILDNAKIHHTESVHSTLDLLEVCSLYLICLCWLMRVLIHACVFTQRQGISHLFLPPYSPFLNPIEYAFSKIKSVVRKITLTNGNELQVAIEQGLDTVTPQDTANWCKHITHYFNQCAHCLPFRGRPLAPELFSDLAPPSARLQNEWNLYLQQNSTALSATTTTAVPLSSSANLAVVVCNAVA